jgi:hypothetical protein
MAQKKRGQELTGAAQSKKWEECRRFSRCKSNLTKEQEDSTHSSDASTGGVIDLSIALVSHQLQALHQHWTARLLQARGRNARICSCTFLVWVRASTAWDGQGKR